MEENKNVINNNNIQISTESKSNIKSALIVIIIVLIILLGIVGYFLFIKNSGEEKVNINYDVLDYQCEKEYCDSGDYANIKQLLKTDDVVKSLKTGNDNKNHIVLLESITNGNMYLYLVDEDKYYFKNDNYYYIDCINGGYESGIGYIYDYDYVVVHQKITKHYENIDVNTANSKIYSFKDEKYVFEIDDYYDCSYAEYKNQRFYKLTHNGDSTLYDDKFNKIFDADTYGKFAFDDKYIFGIIDKNSKYRFFRYNIADKKYELSDVEVDDLSDCTYNYIVNSNDGEYEIYDFDGNSIFKTDEKSYLKDINIKEYVLPEIPQIYYSKAENKIKLIIEPDVCGDESCPPYFGYSYYEYNIKTKSITHKFSNGISDDIYQNLFDGYVLFDY